jgi:flagellum-specific ATP synthase
MPYYTKRKTLLLMPHHDIVGISAGALVKLLNRPILNPIGNGLLGRIVNGYGEVLDGGAPLTAVQPTTLRQNSNNPMKIGHIDTILDVGVKAINALLTVGQGQRIGLLAGSGIGKSVLLA